MKARATAALIVASLVLGGGSAYAQLPSWLRGYYLNVPLWSEPTSLDRGGLADLQRLRLMAEHHLGPLSLQVDYEHLASYSQRGASGLAGSLAGAVGPGGGGLQWTLEESEHVLWRHRFDRVNVSYAPFSFLETTVGRQTISWATTLLLTPADPFVPFDPADPFREFRAGVDAVRVQFFPGPLADVDLVLRASDTPVGETVTLLGRVRGVLHGWELSGWAGALHEEPALGVGATGGVGQAALRVEASLREDDDGSGIAIRGSIGVDTRFEAFDRDLYVALEYQHDDFGASSAEGLSRVVVSEPFVRGELQVLGREETVAQATYQVHPLLSTEFLVIWNLNDRSALLAPALSYSVTNEATARAGVFIGMGSEEVTRKVAIPSEFGTVGAIVYASGSLFF